MKKIRIAVIGCGRVFTSHWDGYVEQRSAGYDDFEIAAFCDIVKSRAQDYADKYAGLFGTKPLVFDSVESLLASGIQFDAAEVQTPHSEHHAVALPLLNAGIHVFIEKPLAITMRAAKLMMDAAHRNGVALKVMEDYRYALPERAAAWAVTSGLIGTPRLMTMLDIGLRQWSWDWRDQKYVAGGSWTIDGGVHFADLWMNILGPVRRVQAIMHTYDNIHYKNFETAELTAAAKENQNKYRQTRSLLAVNPQTFGEPVESDLDDTTSAILEFENGVTGSWLVSRAVPGKVIRSISISGSKGALVWREGISDYKQELVISWDELQKMFIKSISHEQKEFLFPHGMQHTIALEQREFFDFLKGERKLEVTDETGYLDMAVPYAVYEAAVSGHAVLLRDVIDLKIENYQKPINDRLGIR